MKKLNKNDVIFDLQHNIYCRIKPSKVHGIGVFAIRDIPKNTNPFITLRKDEEILLDIEESLIMDNKMIHPEVKTLVKDFYTVRDGKIEFPARGLNEIDISFFMNTATVPNIGTNDEGETFYALRKIETGEELLINYADITDKTEV